MGHIRKLAGEIGVRVQGTNGEFLGSRYIARKFRVMGYEVDIQKFTADGQTSRNVIAYKPDGMSDRFVIGAHMDSVRGSPGANDNASGVAVMLEVARLIANNHRAKFIKFVAFGSEEYGGNGVHHVGSATYVARRTDRSRRRIPGMISVDMVADGRPLLVGTAGIGPDVVAKTLFRKIKATGIDVAYRTLCDCSDNGPFERAGIPGAFMWSGLEPNYHDPSDTVANLSRRDVRRSGRALLAFVRALKRDMITRFRQY
jgi:Zn-dependent M28 family amino/carboxypeptidase